MARQQPGTQSWCPCPAPFSDTEGCRGVSRRIKAAGVTSARRPQSGIWVSTRLMWRQQRCDQSVRACHGNAVDSGTRAWLPSAVPSEPGSTPLSNKPSFWDVGQCQSLSMLHPHPPPLLLWPGRLTSRRMEKKSRESTSVAWRWRQRYHSETAQHYIPSGEGHPNSVRRGSGERAIH